jgi:hypothetical protein
MGKRTVFSTFLVSTGQIDDHRPGEKKAKLAREFGISRQTLYESLRRVSSTLDQAQAPAPDLTTIPKEDTV